jgi:hypothetical protein
LYAIDGLIAAVYGLALLSFLLWDRGWKGKLVVYAALTLALLTKLQALYLIPILFLWTGFGAMRGFRRTSPENELPGYDTSGFIKEWLKSAGVVGASCATFFILWPALWLDFPKGVFQYLDFITTHSNVPVLYFGTLYKGDSIPPWHYPWVFTAIALPLTLTVPAMVRLLRTLRECVKKDSTQIGREDALLWAGALLPLWVSSLPQAPKYDGIRLLLPAYGPLSILAGLEIARWWNRLEIRLFSDLAKLVRASALALLAFLVLLPSIRVYPFNLVYYSPSIRGTHGARERGFDLDYLGVSMHRLNPALAEHARHGDLLLLAGCNALVGPRAADEWFPVSNKIRFTTDFTSFPDLQRGVLQQMKSEGMRVFAIIGSRYSDLNDKALLALETVPELDRVEYDGERLFSLHQLPQGFIERWRASEGTTSP